MWVGGGGWFRGGIIWWGGRQPSDPPTSTTRKQDHTYLGEVAGDRLGLYTVAQVTVFGWWGGGESRRESMCCPSLRAPLPPRVRISYLAMATHFLPTMATTAPPLYSRIDCEVCVHGVRR